MIELKNISNILVVCDEPWSPMWMSKHHYTNELVKLGYDVYFVDPPGKWSAKNIVSKISTRKEGKIKVLTIPNRYPIGINPEKALKNDVINLNALRKIGILGPKTLVWNFDGRRFAEPGCKMIYHIVDNNKAVLLDDIVSKNSDLIVCTSEHFIKGYENASCPKIVIPHGISLDELTIDKAACENIKSKHDNFLLSVGSFSKKSNLQLLQLISDSFPEFTLLLLGSDHLGEDEQWQKLIGSSNVSFEGVVPAAELKNYISAARICLTCYLFDHASTINLGAASSLKNMNYLAQNKITISTLANDLDLFQNRGIYSADNSADFVSLIEKGLNSELSIDEDLIQSELKSLLYPKLIQQILTKLDNLINIQENSNSLKDESISGEQILVISNEPWGDIWYSKQNYAYELSKTNKVIFINPVGRWNPKSLFSALINKTKYNDNLTILNYSNALPVRTSFLDKWNNKITSKRLRKQLQKDNFLKPIHWSFDPFRLYDHKLFNAKIGIYHCVDLYGFKYYGERQIASNSDVIFVSSKTFFDTYQKFNKPMFSLPHGISSEEFKVSPTESNEVEIGHKDYGLYTGVIDERIDFGLLEKALVKFKDVPFLFLGPHRLPDNEIAHRIFTENKYPNLFAPGAVHFKKLKVYIAEAKFCISFMNTKIEGNMIAHHKSLLYLSHGKPVFGAAFSEYKNLDEIFYMSNDHDELLNMLGAFLENGEPSEFSKIRISYAQEYTFENILSQARTYLKDMVN